MDEFSIQDVLNVSTSAIIDCLSSLIQSLSKHSKKKHSRVKLKIEWTVNILWDSHISEFEVFFEASRWLHDVFWLLTLSDLEKCKSEKILSLPHSYLTKSPNMAPMAVPSSDNGNGYNGDWFYKLKLTKMWPQFSIPRILRIHWRSSSGSTNVQPRVWHDRCRLLQQQGILLCWGQPSSSLESTWVWSLICFPFCNLR